MPPCPSWLRMTNRPNRTASSARGAKGTRVRLGRGDVDAIEQYLRLSWIRAAQPGVSISAGSGAGSRLERFQLLSAWRRESRVGIEQQRIRIGLRALEAQGGGGRALGRELEIAGEHRVRAPLVLDVAVELTKVEIRLRIVGLLLDQDGEIVRRLTRPAERHQERRLHVARGAIVRRRRQSLLAARQRLVVA